MSDENGPSLAQMLTEANACLDILEKQLQAEREKVKLLREAAEEALWAIPDSAGGVHVPGEPCPWTPTERQEHKTRWIREQGMVERLEYWQRMTTAHRSANQDRVIHEHAKELIEKALAATGGRKEG